MRELIAQRRGALNLTQAEAARQAKVSLNTWQRVEAGQPARRATLQRMAAVLKIPASQLAPAKEQEPQTEVQALKRRTEFLELHEKMNRLYPTPKYNTNDDNEDYPVVSALVAHYLIAEADMLSNPDMGRMWLPNLPLWVRLHVHGNEPWLEAMDAEFKRLADWLEAGKGLPPLINHARIAALQITASWAQEVGKDMYDEAESALDGRPEDLDQFVDAVYDHLTPDDELLMALAYHGPLTPKFPDLYGTRAHLHPLAWFDTLFADGTTELEDQDEDNEED